jgi:hypothetical protein
MGDLDILGVGWRGASINGYDAISRLRIGNRLEPRQIVAEYQLKTSQIH